MTLRQRAVVFKALGHRARLAVVERLALGECCVCELMELAEVSGLSGPTVSQHLLVLKAAGVISDKKRGRRVCYRLLLPGAAGLSLQPRERKPKSTP